MANSVDPDQTAPIGAVCSGSTLFASVLNSSVILGHYLQQTTSADDFSRRHFQMHFFLGTLRVNMQVQVSGPLFLVCTDNGMCSYYGNGGIYLGEKYMSMSAFFYNVAQLDDLTTNSKQM